MNKYGIPKEDSKELKNKVENSSSSDNIDSYLYYDFFYNDYIEDAPLYAGIVTYIDTDNKLYTGFTSMRRIRALCVHNLNVDVQVGELRFKRGKTLEDFILNYLSAAISNIDGDVSQEEIDFIKRELLASFKRITKEEYYSYIKQ